MASVEEHYDNLLAPYYSWICGGADLKIKENQTFFSNHGISPVGSKTAVDLGAGSGFQSIPLAESGFNVIALDTNRLLLKELKARAGDLPIVTVCDDMLNFGAHCAAEAEIMVCMGDSLAHLKHLEDVEQLLEKIYAALAPDGHLVLGFRDMTGELTGLDRFISVRSDADRIFTCFLEYEKQHVKVHDIIYEKVNDRWQMKKSAFRKLRIFPEWLKKILAGLGYQTVKFDIRSGWVTVIARKR